MKLDLKSVLRLAAACSGALWFTGCEVEAEEAAAGTNGPVVASTNTSAGTPNAPLATVVTNVSGTNVAATALGTNAVANASGTNITDNETVILNRIDPTLPPDLKLSKGVQDVIKLAQSGVSETVQLLFVEKVTEPFDLDAAEILYLNDIGIPQTVIASMLNHDGASPELKNTLATNQVQVAAAPPPAPAAAFQATAPTVEVSSNYVADPNYQAQAPAVQQAQAPVVVQQQPIVVNEPAVTHSYFYSSLSPYGSWVDVAGYGWCWQPSIAVVNPGWRPYAHGGRWLQSNNGWYWHSDYSWGWAPFHYGRWYCAPRYGWIWTPDYTWGPSWVTWRYSGSYCGWAPLPPRCYVRPGIGFTYWGSNFSFSYGFGYGCDYYTFVPTRRFHERHVSDHFVPTEKTVNIYKDSTVVNNYISGNNNTIVNSGIGRDQIVSHTRQEIPRVRVEEAAISPGARGGAIQPDRIHREGNEMVVYRPKTPPAALASASGQSAPNRQEMRRPSAAAGGFGAAPATPTASTAPSPRAGQEARRNEPAVASLSGNQGSVRSSISSRSQPPVFGTPAPLRPSAAPAYSPSVQSSRAVQEARVRTEVSANSALTRQSVISRTGTAPVVTPSANGRFANQPAMPPSISGQPSASVNSSISSRPVTPTQNSRFGSTAPAMPPSISGQQLPTTSTRTETRFGRSEVTRQSINPAPATVPQAGPQQQSRFGTTRSPVAPQASRSESISRPSVSPAPQAAPLRLCNRAVSPLSTRGPTTRRLRPDPKTRRTTTPDSLRPPARPAVLREAVAARLIPRRAEGAVSIRRPRQPSDRPRPPVPGNLPEDAAGWKLADNRKTRDQS